MTKRKWIFVFFIIYMSFGIGYLFSQIDVNGFILVSVPIGISLIGWVLYKLYTNIFVKWVAAENFKAYVLLFFTLIGVAMFFMHFDQVKIFRIMIFPIGFTLYSVLSLFIESPSGTVEK